MVPCFVQLYLAVAWLAVAAATVGRAFSRHLATHSPPPQSIYAPNCTVANETPWPLRRGVSYFEDGSMSRAPAKVIWSGKNDSFTPQEGWFTGWSGGMEWRLEVGTGEGQSLAVAIVSFHAWQQLESSFMLLS